MHARSEIAGTGEVEPCARRIARTRPHVRGAKGPRAVARSDAPCGAPTRGRCVESGVRRGGPRAPIGRAGTGAVIFAERARLGASRLAACLHGHEPIVLFKIAPPDFVAPVWACRPSRSADSDRWARAIGCALAVRTGRRASPPHPRSAAVALGHRFSTCCPGIAFFACGSQVRNLTAVCTAGRTFRKILQSSPVFTILCTDS